MYQTRQQTDDVAGPVISRDKAEVRPSDKMEGVTPVVEIVEIGRYTEAGVIINPAIGEGTSYRPS